MAHLFAVDTLRAIELGDEDTPSLQAFFEDNADYFLIVNGEPPSPGEARDEIHDPLPAGFTYTKKWVLGFFDDAGAMTAMANVVSDLIAARVWHIGLFIAGMPVRGTGVARSLYVALEEWARSHGAEWMRLGVVEGNARAERFWRSLGYAEVRQREIEMGKRVNTVLVMMKPLAGGSREQYLAIVERDRP